VDKAICYTETRRLELRLGHPRVTTKRAHIPISRAPSAKRPRTANSIATPSRSAHSSTTETHRAVSRPERTAAPQTSRYLDVNQSVCSEEEPSSQNGLTVSPTTSTNSGNSIHGYQGSETLERKKAWRNAVRSIQSTVKTIESHKDSWLESTCTFTALIGSSERASMITRESYGSSEAIEAELANTFAQVDQNIHQCQIFKKLLAYTVSTLWAGKHLGGSKEVMKVRRYGSIARNFVSAAEDSLSILLLAPPSW
jgi:hypothetical protein